MTRIRVHSIFTSLDGFAAGPDQDADNPLGVGGQQLTGWIFATEFGHAMMGKTGGTTGIDDAWLRRGDVGIGAHVMGRNMFGPVRGPWPDESWTGWWGPNPPYHHEVFVLTHYPRPSFEMEGGTTFHFVTDGLEAAIARATEAAGGQDVRIGGGAATLRAALAAGIVDELHVAVAPVTLGAGERLWDPSGDWPSGYTVVEREASDAVTHYRFERA
jgi:dihydrofolate reductase